MKTHSVILLVTLSIFYISCAKDKDKSPLEETGKVTIEGTVYTINVGELTRGESDDVEVFVFQIILASIDLGNELNSIDVADFLMLMEFYSETQDKLKSGTYTYDEDGLGITGTCGNGIIAIGLNEELWETPQIFHPTEGLFEIERGGDYYQLSFHLIADKHEDSQLIATNVSIDGNFTGILEQKHFY